FARSCDPRAGRPAAVEHLVAHRMVHLGRDHNVVTTIAHGGTDDLFRFSVRVHIGGVDEVDTAVERTMHDAHAIVVVRIAVLPEHHCAETEPANCDARPPECRVLHIAPKVQIAGD